MKFPLLLLLSLFLHLPAGRALKCWTCENVRTCDNPLESECAEQGITKNAACFSGPRGLSCVNVKDCGIAIPDAKGNETVIVQESKEERGLWNPFASDKKEPTCCQTDLCNGSQKGNSVNRNWILLVVTSLFYTWWQ